MDEIKKRFDQLVSLHSIGRTLYAAIKKDVELVKWLENNVPQAHKLSEQVYCMVNDISPICVNGNLMSFKDSWKGYMMCGRSGSCKCWEENQTQKVSNAKKSMTDDQQTSVMIKRRTTNLKKYGTEFAMQNSDVKKKTADSNMKKYGVSTTLLVPAVQRKIKESLVKKYGVDHPMKSHDIKNKSMNTCLDRYGAKTYPHCDEGRILVRKVLKERYNVSGISQLKFSQTVRDLLQDKDLLVQEFLELGIFGICNKYPELSYDTCRDNLIRHGVKFVKKFTKPEMFIKEFFESQKIKFIHNTRKIIAPQELDFYLPDHNIAIEVCGLYWHRESLLKNKLYHVQKLQKCLDQGINLITIFTDQITKKPDIVIERLKSKLNLLPRTHHARKLSISETCSRTAIKEFLNRNHIQGSQLGTINLSAIDDNGNIIAVMTLGKLRVSLGQKKQIDNTFELYRFASSGNIPGIASKMYQYFLKRHNPQMVISYSDRCWGEGKLYTNLGFNNVSTSGPNYWYTDNFLDRYHRYKFAKHSLVQAGYDPALTEFEIMESRNYDRIYDCGSHKFVWRPNTINIQTA